MNILNFLNHKLYTPDYYDRQYSHDLQYKREKFANIKRVALIALPFIALFSVPGKIISLTMNGIRSISNILNIYGAKALSFDQLHQIFQLSLSVISIVGVFFSFKIGIMITSFADIIENIKDFILHLSQKEYKQALNEILLCISSTLYIGMICYGSLEIVLASIILKIILCTYEAADEFSKAKYPEFAAKIAMGLIRTKNAYDTVKSIQRRNFLNSLDKFTKLLEKIKNSKEINPLYDHPLTSLESKIEDGKVVFYDDQGNCFDFGAHFSAYGSGLVKGMNITFRKTEDYTELEFKVNHVFRQKIEENIQALQKACKNPKELKAFLILNKANIDGIKISTLEEKTKNWWDFNTKTTCKVDIIGKGTIEIGSSPEFINSYDTVKVTLREGESIYNLHQTLCMLGLEDALKQSSLDDLQRMKLGHLFHSLSPEEAFKLERSEAFFNLSTEELKREMIQKDPKMKGYFDSYLDTMELKDILPGRSRMHMLGLTKDLIKEFGNFHLTTMLTGTNNPQELFKRLSCILQIGLLSEELRTNAGSTKKGLNADHDFVGARDSAFAQVITSQTSYDELMYTHLLTGGIRILLDPKVIESGTYQYPEDILGHRTTDSWFSWGAKESEYDTRDGIHDFLAKQFKNPTPDNEIMIKDNIPPEYITGIVVENKIMKSDLLLYMSKMGHYKDGLLFGKNAETFIQVGQTIKK